MKTIVYCDGNRCSDEADKALCDSHLEELLEDARKEGFQDGYNTAKNEYSQ